MDHKTLDELKKEFPGRENQIKLIYQLLFQDEHDSKASVKLLLHGLPNTGKTSVILKLLQLFNKFYIFVDCKECYQLQLLFHSIFHKLCEEGKSIKCNNLAEFLNSFKSMSASDTKLDFLILKNCSSLLNNSQIEAFMHLPQILAKYGWNFSIIFIDQITSSYYEGSFVYHLSRIFFPRYNTDDLKQILLLKRPQYRGDFFKIFLDCFLSFVSVIYRDVFEILQLADVVFAVVDKPTDDEEITVPGTQKLYKQVNKILEVKSDNLAYMYPQSILLGDEIKLTNNIEMPTKVKYLLISSYLASVVSPKMDKQLFRIKSSKQRKRAQVPNGNCPENKISSVLGPKSFTLNRLLSIFSALIGERCCVSTALLQQITSLVEMKLLLIVGNEDDNVDKPRYKCVADLDLVSHIAKSVDCEFERYLV